MNAHRPKLLLLGLIFLSCTFYLPLFSDGLDAYTLGRFIGFFGLQLIFWQIILGNRRIVRVFTPDLMWANQLHRRIGTYGFLIILLHPLLMTSVYGLTLVWPPSFASVFDIGVRAGTLAISILAFIWVTSATLRGKGLSWRWWKRLHYTAYILYPILFLHLTLTGSSMNQFSWLPVWLFIMNTIFLAVLLLRAAGWAGITKLRYEVLETTEVAKAVTRFRLQPIKKSVTPLPGQFAYFQGWIYGEAHPFTISHYDEESKEISFSIKAVGSYSSKLTNLKPGDTVFIDGPYGVFTKEMSQTRRPVVAIAGGIGITPFLRNLELGRIDYLFLGCRTEDDIAYYEAITSSQAEVCYILSESSDQESGHESGVVTADLIKNKLKMSLEEYDFYLCGPPAMMQSLFDQLVGHGVSADNIYQEKFSL